jgi:glycosyltransferase involved in cell wall biosynthesis
MSLRLGLGPTVQFIHNDSAGLLGTESDSIWNRFRRLYLHLESYVLRTSRAVAIFNRVDLGRIQEIRTDAVRVQTWFDPEVFFPPPEKGRAEDMLRICWVGRLESQKDPLLAVDVMSKLAQRRFSPQRATLTMAGSGTLGPQVRQQIREAGHDADIHLPGALSRADVADLMRRSDVLLVTSHYEGSPTILAEAGATGLPVVATDGADPDQFLVRGLNGVRVDDRAAGQLAAAVIEAAGYTSATCSEMAQGRSADRYAGRLADLGRSGPSAGVESRNH